MSKNQDERFRPVSDDTALEDTEGHMPLRRVMGTEDDDTEDTEGHMPRRM